MIICCKRLDIHLSEISTHDNLLNERGTQYFGLCQQVKDCVLYYKCLHFLCLLQYKQLVASHINSLTFCKRDQNVTAVDW